jgi:hypothetical protein
MLAAGDIAFDDDGNPVLSAAPAPHDEFSEVLEIIRAWNVSDRLQLFEALGLTAPTSPGGIREAYARGHEAGRAAGMRELLELLFRGAKTVPQVGERAAVIAMVQECPDAPAKSIRELAALTGLGNGTAKSRVDEFLQSAHTLPKLNTLLPDSIG